MNYFDFFIDSQDKLPEDIEKLVVGKVSMTTSAFLLKADQILAIRTDATLTELHAIKNSAAGDLHYQKVS